MSQALREEIGAGNKDVGILGTKFIIEIVDVYEMMQRVKKRWDPQSLALTFRGRHRARSLPGRLRAWPTVNEANWEREASWEPRRGEGKAASVGCCWTGKTRAKSCP